MESVMAKTTTNTKNFNGAEKLKKEAEQTTITVEDDKKKTYVTSGMSKLSRSERKIVSKILSIVTEIAPKDIAEQIIEKINQSCLLLFLANGRTAWIDLGLCRYCPCQH